METDSDHRQGYSILRVYTNGMRFVGDYDQHAAVEHYMTMHPDANEAAVRAELESELARLEAEYQARVAEGERLKK